MSTTQIKAKPTAQPATNARDLLARAAQELATARAQLGQAQDEYRVVSEELAVLLVQGKSSEKEAFDLQAARSEAHRTVQAARADLGRNIGRAAEEQYVAALASAEDAAAKVTAQLEAFESRTQRTTVLQRIVELRRKRETSEQAVADLSRRARELSDGHEVAFLVRSKESIRALLETFQDMLAVCELHGEILAELRNSEPQLYNTLLSLLALTPGDWGQLWTSCESHDGKIANYRGPLIELQNDVKRELAKLNQ